MSDITLPSFIFPGVISIGFIWFTESVACFRKLRSIDWGKRPRNSLLNYLVYCHWQPDVISVRQTRALPAFFRFPLTAAPPCSWLYTSHYQGVLRIFTDQIASP